MLFHLSEESARGITFIEKGKDDYFVSYKDIVDRAKQALGMLQEQGLHKGSKILLQVENNELYVYLIWGAFIGGMVPIPLAVARNPEEKMRVEKIVSQIPDVYTISDQKEDRMYQGKYLSISISEFREMEQKSECLWESIAGSDTAIIQFSSGSTGVPKGIVLSHNNIVVSAYDQSEKVQMTKEARKLTWIPLTHSMGLLADCMSSFYVGNNQFFMSPKHFIENPAIWLKKITQYHITLTSCPNFGFSHILSMMHELDTSQLDLSSLERIITGGEPVSVKEYHRFLDSFASCGLKEYCVNPSYGLSEATVAVTTNETGKGGRYISVKRNSLSIGEKAEIVETAEEGVMELPSSGTPFEHIELRIVDRNGQICEEGYVGIIEVRGEVVASGYYQNEVETKKVFLPDGWLHTGDVGFLYNQQLYIAGRERDIIIVNGKNYYVHDLERVIEGLDVIKAGTCFVISSMQSGKEEVVVLLDKDSGEYSSIHGLEQTVKQHLLRKTGVLPKKVIIASNLPRTSSLKIKRSELVKNYENGVFQMDSVIRKEVPFESLFYHMKWVEVSKQNSTELLDTNEFDTYVFVMDNIGVCEDMANMLAETKKVIQISADTDWRTKLTKLLSQTLTENKTCVIYGKGLDATQTNKLKSDVLYQEELSLLADLLFVMQSVISMESKEKTKLWVLTKNCQFTSKDLEDKKEVCASLGAFWGLSRTFALEHPECFGGIADLEGNALNLSLQAVLKLIVSGIIEQQLCIRQGKGYAPRIVRTEGIKQPVLEPSFSSEETYLITGGLGGIGQVLAKYLVNHGVRHLVLVSRSGLPDRQNWVSCKQKGEKKEQILCVEELEKIGAEVTILTADVKNSTELQQAMDKLNFERFPLKGVIHAASGFGTCSIQSMDMDTVDSVMGAKVLGALNLHEATKNMQLNFFLMFSSMSGILGAKQLAHYGAANSFIDALAYYRHSLGLPAKVICWGAWGEAGALKKQGQVEQFAKYGHYAITNKTGLDAIQTVLNSDTIYQMVVDMDWERMKEVFQINGNETIYDEAGVDQSLLSEEIKRVAAMVKETEGQKQKEATIQFLKMLFAKELELPSYEKVELECPFMDMGIQSLKIGAIIHAINQYLMEEDEISIADLFNHTTIDRLADYILSLVNCVDEPKEIEENSLLKLLDKIEECTDEMLDEKWRDK